MPDDFKLEGDNLEPEASLDDFFQPSAEPAKPGKPSKPEPKKGAKPAASDAHLPVDKDKPLFDDEPAPSPPALEVTDADAEPAAEEKSGGGLLSNKLLLIGIAVLAVLVVGVGVYYGYTKFFGKEEEVVAPAPKPKAPAQEPAPAPEKTAQAAPAAETKQPPAAPAKPETPAPPAAKAQPKTEAKAVPPEKKPAPPAKAPEKVAPTPPVKPGPEAKAKPAAPPPAPGKEASAKQPEIKKAPGAPLAKPPVGAQATPPAQSKPAPAAKAAPPPAPKAAMVSTGPYTLQVGSYAFEESKTAPEAKLKELGLTDYHYVDQAQRVHLYDVVAGKGLDKTRADTLLNSLAGLKFVPRLEPEGDRYKVIAYSYGNRADAERARAKIEKAGLGKVSISSYSKTMTLHQLRVGGYPSAAATRANLATLRKAGFHPVIVRER